MARVSDTGKPISYQWLGRRGLWIMPRHTRALPDRAIPFSRFVPPVNPLALPMRRAHRQRRSVA
jgi:hypothetical protein